VERAFLLTNSSERAEAQQIAFIDAARQTNAHVVKLSQFGADTHWAEALLHAVVEVALQASGIGVYVSPNLFM